MVSENTGKPTKSVPDGSPSAVTLCVNGYMEAPIVAAKTVDKRYPTRKIGQSCVEKARTMLEIDFTAAVDLIHLSGQCARNLGIGHRREFCNHGLVT